LPQVRLPRHLHVSKIFWPSDPVPHLFPTPVVALPACLSARFLFFYITNNSSVDVRSSWNSTIWCDY
jgi:hypothetical protein